MPEMHITTTPGVPSLHELKGWKELDQWGCYNHAHWRAIRDRTEWAEGMSEIDKLRLLAGEMLRLNVDLMERYLETARLLPVPPIFIPENSELSQP